MSTIEKAFKTYSDTIRRIFNPNWIKLFATFQQNLLKKIHLSYFLNHNIFYESNPWISELNISSALEQQLVSPQETIEEPFEEPTPSFRITIMRRVSQLSQNISRIIRRTEKPVKTYPEITKEEKPIPKKITLNKYIEEISSPLILASPFQITETSIETPKVKTPRKLEEEIKIEPQKQVDLTQQITISNIADEEKIQLKESLILKTKQKSEPQKIKPSKKIIESMIIMNTLLGSQLKTMSKLNSNYIKNVITDSVVSPEQMLAINQNYDVMNIAKNSPISIIESRGELLLRSGIARQRLLNIPSISKKEEKIFDVASKIIEEKTVSERLNLIKQAELQANIMQQNIKEKSSILQEKTSEIIDIIEEKKIFDEAIPIILEKSISEEIKTMEITEPVGIAKINSMDILRRLNSYAVMQEGRFIPIVKGVSQVSKIKNTLHGFRLLEKLSSRVQSDVIPVSESKINLNDVANVSTDYLTTQLISSIANLSMLPAVTAKIREDISYDKQLPIANIRLPDITNYSRQQSQVARQKYNLERTRTYSQRETQKPVELKIEADIDKIDVKDFERRLAKLLKEEARRRGVY